MNPDPVAQIFAEEWPRLVAVLVRDLGDLALAEDAAQDAFVEAARRWGPGSTPDRPGAWLLTTARRKALDGLRRQRRFDERLPRLAAQLSPEPAVDHVDEADPRQLGDAQLALVFGCCHPSLAPDAQVALTLRHVCGLSTAQIARAFLVPEATMAKRLVRAKHKITAARVPFSVPEPEHRRDRLDAVLGVIYLVFTEGHTASDSARLIRGDLCDEARWLASLMTALLPTNPRSGSALLAFTDARRATRADDHGDLVLLEDQDRSRWDRAAIDLGHRQLERASIEQRTGPTNPGCDRRRSCLGPGLE
ncbi:MAG: sigma-70 family RNA polymerase sigma factor [Ilumatobacteraceae bacterium]